jgi:multiple sugar transport system permease protein
VVDNPGPPFRNEGEPALNSILVRRKWEPYVCLLPSILLMSFFVIFPIGIVFKLSFSQISKAGTVGAFIGLSNFREAVSDKVFGTVMLNTLYWVVSVVGLSTLIGFIVAMMMNSRFHGRKIARSVLIFPWATSLVIQASIWNYIINFEYGNLNNILLNLGIIKDAINWRASYPIEFMWECGVGIFVTIPFVTFCILAGLQSIDEAYYEAATVDGAGYWKKLTKVTLPLVRPSLTVSTVLNIIYVFNSFPIIYTITKGAPANKTDTMVTYLYMLAFYDQRKGPATALSVIGFAILCVVAGLYMMMTMRKDEL